MNYCHLQLRILFTNHLSGNVPRHNILIICVCDDLTKANASGSYIIYANLFLSGSRQHDELHYIMFKLNGPVQPGFGTTILSYRRRDRMLFASGSSWCKVPLEQHSHKYLITLTVDSQPKPKPKPKHHNHEIEAQ